MARIKISEFPNYPDGVIGNSDYLLVEKASTGEVYRLAGSKIGDVTGLHFEVVPASQLEQPGNNKTIYLILDSSASSGNVYNEYVYVNNTYELIGSTSQIDLDDYMVNEDPVGTGSFSMNRASDTEVGNYSTTLGNECEANQPASVAAGLGTIAASEAQVVIGRYNEIDNNADYGFIVGDGIDDDNRETTFAVEWRGNVMSAGTPEDNNHLAKISTLQDIIAPDYDSTHIYAVNDLVIFTGKLYKCISTISSPEAWNSSHWTQIHFADQIKEIWLSGTLTAGNTTLTLNSAAVTANSLFDIYTSVYTITPTNAVATTGSITLTFAAQSSDVSIKVRVINQG